MRKMMRKSLWSSLSGVASGEPGYRRRLFGSWTLCSMTCTWAAGPGYPYTSNHKNSINKVRTYLLIITVTLSFLVKVVEWSIVKNFLSSLCFLCFYCVWSNNSYKISQTWERQSCVQLPYFIFFFLFMTILLGFFLKLSTLMEISYCSTR